MANEDRIIGSAKCPLCPSAKASVRLNKKQLAYLVCNSCNMQLFTRSDRSDEALRALVVRTDALPAAPVAAEPEPAPIPPAVEAKPGPGRRSRDSWEPF